CLQLQLELAEQHSMPGEEDRPFVDVMVGHGHHVGVDVLVVDADGGAGVEFLFQLFDCVHERPPFRPSQGVLVLADPIRLRVGRGRIEPHATGASIAARTVRTAPAVAEHHCRPGQDGQQCQTERQPIQLNERRSSHARLPCGHCMRLHERHRKPAYPPATQITTRLHPNSRVVSRFFPFRSPKGPPFADRKATNRDTTNSRVYLTIPRLGLRGWRWWRSLTAWCSCRAPPLLAASLTGRRRMPAIPSRLLEERAILSC